MNEITTMDNKLIQIPKVNSPSVSKLVKSSIRLLHLPYTAVVLSLLLYFILTPLVISSYSEV